LQSAVVDRNNVRTRRRIQLASDIDPEIPERASLVDRLEDSNDMFAGCRVSSWVRRKFYLWKKVIAPVPTRL